jgi:hypothetical protein
MDFQFTPENQSAWVDLPVADKLSRDGAPADKKKGIGRTILYARVSTADQTLAHQREQAEAVGFHLDEVLADHGVSGLSTMLSRIGPRGGGCSICSGRATPLSFVGWTV